MGKSTKEKYLQSIASRIKELRLQRNITQEQFYFDTSIHIARIESGKSDIRVYTLNSSCKYFKISTTEFFEGLI